MDERSIETGLRHKNEAALKEAIRYYSPLAATIINNISNGSLTAEDIEEVLSDVFITLWNNSEKIADGKLKSYLCCIAKTRAINKLSTVRHNVVNIDDYDPEDNFSIEDETETKDINRELNEMIDTIKEPDKEILMRYYFYYQSAPKIAAALGFTVETIKYRLKRTRNLLKEKLIERGFSI